MITALLIAGAAALGYIFGYGRGWVAAFRFLGQLAQTEEDDPWAAIQREQAPFQ